MINKWRRCRSKRRRLILSGKEEHKSQKIQNETKNVNFVNVVKIIPSEILVWTCFTLQLSLLVTKCRA